MPRFVLGYLDWAERLRTGEQANFQEKALSVKADVAAPWWSSATTPSPSRYASIHTLRVSPLSGDSVHYGIHLFGLWRNDGLKVLPLKGLWREGDRLQDRLPGGALGEGEHRDFQRT